MTRVLVAVAAGALAVAGVAGAAVPQAPLTPGQRALDGFWRLPVPPRPAGAQGPSPNTLAYTAVPMLTSEAAAYNTRYHAAEAAGIQQRTPDNLCLPWAIPGAGVPGGPAYEIEIQVEPALAAFLYEDNRTIRLARMAASHPPGLAPSWLGQSIAHWEGDTLVVDTIGFNDKNMMAQGIPMTSDLHVVQRLRVVDGQLEDQTVLDDPHVFRAPFTVVTRFVRGAPFQESICAENNQEGGVPTADGQTTPAELH